MEQQSNRNAQLRSFVPRVWVEQSVKQPYRIALRRLPDGEWQLCRSLEAALVLMRADAVQDVADQKGAFNHGS